MATEEELKEAIGCLGTVYPQFVAKELATLTDSIFAAVQGFTDPLAAIADLNIDSIISGVAEISEGDTFGNLAEAGVGLAGQYTAREAAAYAASKTDAGSGTSKRIQQVQNFSEGLINSGITMLSLYNDMPYAIAQRMCNVIIRLDSMKIANLRCLRKHIVQLSNAILVMAENADFKDSTLEDLKEAKLWATEAVIQLELSQPTSDTGEVGFDQKAFERAREALIVVSRSLTPDVDGTSILDAATILSSGSVEAGQVDRSNQALVHLVIPSLTNMIEIEISSVAAQIEVINFYVQKLTEVIQEFRNAGQASRVKTQRSRAIFEISRRLNDMCIAMELVLDRGSITSASGNMLLWSSRVKAAIVQMDELNQLTLKEGSIEGPDKALALEIALSKLIDDLTGINISAAGVVVVQDGIEDSTTLQTKVLGIVKGARKVVKDFENETTSPNRLATLHLLAAQVAKDQTEIVDASDSSALRQIAACKEFAAIDLQVTEKFDTLMDSMRQVGMDRAVDLLGSGQLGKFLSIGMDEMSYLGAAVNCLKDALTGIDDTQTRLQVSSLRDDMVAARTNNDLAAADSGDQGRSRLIDRIGEQISSIQKNAKTAETIVADLTAILESIGGSLSDSVGEFPTFSANVDHLNVGASGHLGTVLEEHSEFANGGVVQCEAT